MVGRSLPSSCSTAAHHTALWFPVRHLNGSNGDNRFTQLPRNRFRLPAIKNIDLRLSKRFNFSERYNLELLAEAFNLFNRTQVFGQSTTLYTPNTNCSNVTGNGNSNKRSERVVFYTVVRQRDHDRQQQVFATPDSVCGAFPLLVLQLEAKQNRVRLVKATRFLFVYELI